MRNFILFLSFFGGVHSFAQQEAPSFWIGIGGSAGPSILTATDIHVGKSKAVGKMTWAGGGYIEGGFMLGEGLGIYTGVGIARYNFGIWPEVESARKQFRIEGAHTYIEVPLGIKYNFLRKDRFNLFINAGAKIAFLMDDKADYYLYSIVSQQTSEETITSKEEGVDMYNKFSILPFVHLGVRIPVGRFSLNVGPEVSFQVNSLYKEAYIPNETRSKMLIDYLSDWKAHYLNIGLRVGVAYHF